MNFGRPYKRRHASIVTGGNLLGICYTILDATNKSDLSLASTPTSYIPACLAHVVPLQSPLTLIPHQASPRPTLHSEPDRIIPVSVAIPTRRPGYPRLPQAHLRHPYPRLTTPLNSPTTTVSQEDSMPCTSLSCNTLVGQSQPRHPVPRSPLIMFTLFCLASPAAATSSTDAILTKPGVPACALPKLRTSLSRHAINFHSSIVRLRSKVGKFALGHSPSYCTIPNLDLSRCRDAGLSKALAIVLFLRSNVE